METINVTGVTSGQPIVVTGSDNVSQIIVTGTVATTGPKGDKGDPGVSTDATSMTKGIIQLTGDLSGTAASPTVPGLANKADDAAVVHKTGNETIAGNKLFNGSVQFAEPSTSSNPATKNYVDAQVSGSTTPDATTTIKGKVKLAGDLAGTADLPTVPGLTGKLNNNGDTMAGTLNMSSNKIANLATPTANGDAANKSYVDGVIAGGSTPDASTTTKGKVQLAGDLGGTAASPTVPGLATKANDASVVHNTTDETITGIKTFSSSPLVPTPTTSNQVANKSYVDALISGDTLVTAPTKTSSFTAVAQNYYPVDATSGNVTVTMPTSVAGQQIAIKKIDSTTNTVIIGSITLKLQNEGKVYVSNGAGGWNAYAGDLSLTQLDNHYQPVYNVKQYGVKADGTTDDSTAINTLMTLVGSIGARIIFPYSASTYLVNSSVNVPSNVTIYFEKGATITTAMLGSNHRGIFNISNKSNITIDGANFIANYNSGGSPTAITSYGHDNLTVKNCSFTGTTDFFGGYINLDGEKAVASFTNTVIENNKFFGGTANQTCIHLYPRLGFTVERTKISFNTFEGTTGTGVSLDAYDLLRDTTITNNTFRDLRYGGTTTTPGVAVFSRLGTTNLIYNTVISNNVYKNTVTTTGHQQGFVYIYGAQGTVISGNSAIGSWTPSQNTAGPAIAPGRASAPELGLLVTNNYFEGFDSTVDADSQIGSIYSGNYIYACGDSIPIGYNIQKYVKVVNNVFHNSSHRSLGAGITLGGATTLIGCEVKDNIFADDLVTPRMTTGIYIASHIDQSSTIFTNNRFYVANGPITQITKNFGDEVAPSIYHGNQFKDNVGTVDIPLAIPQGGTGLTTLPTGILKGSGIGAITAATAPTGTIVGTTDTQTLSNKTLVAPVLGTPASGIATNLSGLPLTTGVTGILPIANGGTGSSSQNFVDLTSTQASIAGAKTFTTSPITMLGVTDAEVRISGSTAGQQYISFYKAAAFKWQIYMPGSSNDLRFFTGSDRLILDNSGNAIIPGKLVAGQTAAPTSTLQSAGSFATTVVTKTANYTATATDATILVDTTAGAVTITLPQVAGRMYRIKKITTDANALNITSSTGNTEGVATFSTTATTRPSYTAQSDGTNNWMV